MSGSSSCTTQRHDASWCSMLQQVYVRPDSVPGAEPPECALGRYPGTPDATELPDTFALSFSLCCSDPTKARALSMRNMCRLSVSSSYLNWSLWYGWFVGLALSGITTCWPLRVQFRHRACRRSSRRRPGSIGTQCTPCQASSACFVITVRRPVSLRPRPLQSENGDQHAEITPFITSWLTGDTIAWASVAWRNPLTSPLHQPGVYCIGEVSMRAGRLYRLGRSIPGRSWVKCTRLTLLAHEASLH